jgi:anti-sigma factor (TIGR02949 family)
MTTFDPCAHCEEVMQQYMDRVLTDTERREAESHLEECAYCEKRYRFEEHLRKYVRQVVGVEPMPVELKNKLSALRTPLQ